MGLEKVEFLSFLILHTPSGYSLLLFLLNKELNFLIMAGSLGCGIFPKVRGATVKNHGSYLKKSPYNFSAHSGHNPWVNNIALSSTSALTHESCLPGSVF